MATKKVNPPDEAGKPVKRTVKKTTPKKSTASAKKAPQKKTPVKKEPARKEPKKPAEAVNDNPQADGKKPRPRSPINGAELPEGRPFKQGEEQRERARRAGRKSGEVRRARKTLREEMLALLALESKDSEGKTHTQQEFISAAMIKEARNGNVKAYEAIRDTIGEKQKEHVEVAVTAPKFESLDDAFAKMTGDAR